MTLIHAAGRSPRRGAIVVITALLLVFLMAMVAFAVDIGWIALVKNQLQVAVDAAAHTGAAELGNGQTTSRTKAIALAGQNVAGGQSDYVSLQTSDVVFGNWNGTTKTFTSGGSPANGVKVTATKELPLFFARVLGKDTQTITASAIACVNPRDIAFVIDLSGSMNNDTEIWATAAINGAFTGYPTVGNDIMQDVFTDFNFGTYPGVSKIIGDSPGQGTGLSPFGYLPSSQLNDNAFTALAKGISNTDLSSNGRTSSGDAFLMDRLASPQVPTLYRIASTDNDATRKDKAYKFIMDYQLKQLMPNAMPAINGSNSTSVAYWTQYLDYVIKSKNSQPTSQNSYQISSGANPYDDAWPNLDSSSYSGFQNKVGYQTYVQFMMDYGRNKLANGRNVPLSTSAPDCPKHTDTDANSAGYGRQFPPREQPTHAGRVAIMAAIKEVQAQNVGINGTLNDHVAVIAFDTASGVQVKYPLQLNSMDYEAAKDACCNLQAVADDTASTATENGLIAGINHLDSATNTNARSIANKVLILLTDGIPNIMQSSSSAITSYKGSNPAVEWFGSGSYMNERNAVLMQTSIMQNKGWKMYAVGLGLGCDRTLLDRAARAAGTGIADPSNPTGPKISPYADGNPADYQDRLTKIFKDIILSKSVSIVN